MLNETIFFYHFLEFGPLDEVVVLAVNFMWTSFTSGIYGMTNGQSRCVGGQPSACRRPSTGTQTSEELKKLTGNAETESVGVFFEEALE